MITKAPLPPGRYTIEILPGGAFDLNNAAPSDPETRDAWILATFLAAKLTNPDMLDYDIATEIANLFAVPHRYVFKACGVPEPIKSEVVHLAQHYNLGINAKSARERLRNEPEGAHRVRYMDTTSPVTVSVSKQLTKGAPYGSPFDLVAAGIAQRNAAAHAASAMAYVRNMQLYPIGSQRWTGHFINACIRQQDAERWARDARTLMGLEGDDERAS